MNTNYKKVDGFGKRLKEERERAKLSRADVGNMLGGVAISTLQAWEGETREPPISKLMELASILKTSANYLLTGEEPTTNDNFVRKAFETAQQIVADGISMVNSYPSINVSAGFGSFNEGVTQPEGREPYSDVLLAELGVKAEHCGVFWAKGHSMAPTIANGDQLLVNLKQNEIKGDNIYLVQNGDSVWVKRVRIKWDSVELISDNRGEYEPIIITKDEAQNLQIIGQVIHTGHRLT